MPRALVVALVLVLAACDRAEGPRPAPAAKWRVYSSLPHSGELRDVHRAAVLAFEQHRGGDVEHVGLDSTRPGMEGHAWEVGVVRDNARRAAADPRAAAYVGEIAAGASASSMPVLGAAGIAQIAPGGTYTGLTRAEGAEDGEPAKYRSEAGPHFVRVIPADHLQAAAAVKWMRRLGTRRLLVVGDGEFYGDGIAQMVATRARAAGIEVSRGSYDVRRLATIRELAKRAAGVDTVYFGGIWQNRAVAVWGRLHRANPRARLIGGDGLAEPAFTTAILRSSRARTYLTDVKLPPPKDFARRFRDRFGHAPHPLAPFGHEAMRHAIAAVTAARGNRRATINELFAAPDIDRHGDVTRGRFGGYRVSRDGVLELERVLLA